ncbi:hypothetical protein C8R44DRAFT_752738 [Mycena epipterygia]|nr:hypothetical protein C8R44DRAFT_752738 [Mycena epipterygia]
MVLPTPPARTQSPNYNPSTRQRVPCENDTLVLSAPHVAKYSMPTLHQILTPDFIVFFPAELNRVCARHYGRESVTPSPKPHSDHPSPPPAVAPADGYSQGVNSGSTRPTYPGPHRRLDRRLRRPVMYIVLTSSNPSVFNPPVNSNIRQLNCQLAATVKLAPVWTHSERSWRPAFKMLGPAVTDMCSTTRIQLENMFLTVGGVTTTSQRIILVLAGHAAAHGATAAHTPATAHS